jgi:hypothetical protein
MNIKTLIKQLSAHLRASITIKLKLWVLRDNVWELVHISADRYLLSELKRLKASVFPFTRITVAIRLSKEDSSRRVAFIRTLLTAALFRFRPKFVVFGANVSDAAVLSEIRTNRPEAVVVLSFSVKNVAPSPPVSDSPPSNLSDDPTL